MTPNLTPEEAMERAAKARDPSWESDPPINRSLYYEGFVDGRNYAEQPRTTQSELTKTREWIEAVIDGGEVDEEFKDQLRAFLDAAQRFAGLPVAHAAQTKGSDDANR